MNVILNCTLFMYFLASKYGFFFQRLFKTRIKQKGSILLKLKLKRMQIKELLRSFLLQISTLTSYNCKLSVLSTAFINFPSQSNIPNIFKSKILITCKATIEMIDVSIGWWYKACPHCKSSTQSCDNTVWCNEKCGELREAPTPWYCS